MSSLPRGSPHSPAWRSGLGASLRRNNRLGKRREAPALKLVNLPGVRQTRDRGDSPHTDQRTMFYDPDKDDHGLPFNPYKSIVVPRPIGWISTLSADGIVNLAPYSQFNNLAYDPPYVMFSASSFPDSGRRKDSANDAADAG